MKKPEDYGIFGPYEILQGTRYGVRLRIRGRLWERRGFLTKTAARIFRDKVRTEVRLGVFVPERYTSAKETPVPLVQNATALSLSGPRVYFVQSVEGGLVKIGFTRKLQERIGTLNRMGAAALSFLGSLAGDRELEQSLHERFARARVRGEWFSLTPDLLRFLVLQNMTPTVKVTVDPLLLNALEQRST
jgi:hypothetical protein